MAFLATRNIMVKGSLQPLDILTPGMSLRPKSAHCGVKGRCKGLFKLFHEQFVYLGCHGEKKGNPFHGGDHVLLDTRRLFIYIGNILFYHICTVE